MESIYLLSLGFFLIAFLYSSVGFGGGSSYLALLALLFISISFIRTTALLSNLIVVSGSMLVYYQRGLFDFRKFFPFVVISIPLAFLGARFRLEATAFFILLGLTLVVASLLLLLRSLKSSEEGSLKNYPNFLTWILGGSIGFLAGLVGIGGGIFLAPLLNLMKWDRPVKIAALASFFILANSVAGLIGLYSAGNFEFNVKESGLLLLAVFLGGQLGIRTSLKWFSGKRIRIITAILIMFVAIRILVVHL